MAIEQLIKGLKGRTIKGIRTDLNGEASFDLKKGQYFVFGIAQIADGSIIWNHPIKLSEREIHIELSNDNAYAINEESLSKELQAVSAEVTQNNID